jgi:hypothetical protein
MLSNLKSLTISFMDPPHRDSQESRSPPPPTCTVLPALTRFEFQGVGGYLDDFVARVDTPLLGSIHITFFDENIFNTPNLARFMEHITRFQVLDEAHVDFGRDGVQVGHLPPTTWTFDKTIRLKILCEALDRQLSSLAQVLTSFFPSIHRVEHLYIHGNPSQHLQNENVENVRWLGIFHPFSAVKNLYVSKRYAPRVAHALRELVGGKTAEVLPNLQNIFLEELQQSGPIQEGISMFVAARQLSGRLITVSLWERKRWV